MPRDAVLVKADWRRQLAGETLPIFDTSRRAHDASGSRGDATWADGDGSRDPDRRRDLHA